LKSKWLKISLVVMLIAGVVFVYYAYTVASTIDTLKNLKTITSWNPLNDLIKEIVDTIMKMLWKAFGVV